jgi:hypothetical protein
MCSLNINQDYFSNDNVLKEINELKYKNSILEKENKKLLNEKEKLEKTNLELLKTLNEILKLNKKDEEINNIDLNEIRNKITHLFYREIRQKHIMPFSPFISNFGLYTNIIKKI